jgi:hypothetical protein
LIRNLALTLVSLIFCALAIWMLTSGGVEDRLMGVGCLAFFGGCALIGGSLLRTDLQKSKIAADNLPHVIRAFRFDPICHAVFGVASWGMTTGAVIFALQVPMMWLAAGPALILFGLGGGALLLRALDRQPMVTIGPDGILDRRVMSAAAPWRAIKAVGFPAIGTVQHLQLVVDGAKTYRRVRAGLFAWVGQGSITSETILIAFQGLDGDLAQALATIGLHKPGILVLGDFED